MDYYREVYEIIENENLLQRFEKLFWDKQLAMLMTKIYSMANSTKNDLKDLIAKKIRKTNYVAIGGVNKDRRVFPEIKNQREIEVDCIIWTIDGRMLIKIEEEYPDIKKLAEELRQLVVVKDYLRGRNTSIHFCNFYAKTNKEIEQETFGLLEKGMAMTGRELCGRLGIDYDEIIKEITKNQEESLNYFINELMKIPEINPKIVKKLKINEK